MSKPHETPGRRYAAAITRTAASITYHRREPPPVLEAFAATPCGTLAEPPVPDQDGLCRPAWQRARLNGWPLAAPANLHRARCQRLAVKAATLTRGSSEAILVRDRRFR